MSGTIRENILFSHRYDETFYNLVLDGASFFVAMMLDSSSSSLCTEARSDVVP
jgi:hypothetical protein